MLKRSLLLLSLIAMGPLAHAQKIVYSHSIPTEEIRLPLQHALGGNVEDIFEEVEYIQLEYGKESAIQRISQLLVTNNAYIIVDDFGHRIIFFDKQGKFIRSINEIPNSKNTPYGFMPETVTYNNQDSLLYVKLGIPSEGVYLHKFDLNGVYKGPVNTRIFNETFLTIHHAVYNYNSPRYIKKENNFELLTLHHKNKKVNLINYHPEAEEIDNEYGDLHNSFSKPSLNANSGYLLRAYDYNIYELSETGLTKIYKLILPLGLSLPENFIADSTYNLKRIDFLRKNNEVIYNLENFMSHRNNFIFYGKNYNKNTTYLYNRNSRKIFNLDKISSSEFNNKLPLSENWGGAFFIGTDEEFLYAYVSPAAIQNAASSKGYKLSNDPQGKTKTLIKEMSYKSNPVLVKFKVKDL